MKSIRMLVGLLCAITTVPGCGVDSDARDDAAQPSAASDASQDGSGGQVGAEAGALRDAAATDASNSGASDAAGGSASDAGSGAANDASYSGASDAGLDASARDGAVQDAGGSGQADVGADKTSCAPRLVACDMKEPSCPANQVASVVNGCFGPCVAIDQCSCTDAPDCPHEESYTCHRSARHCGPYVN
jgi:hypothetical protein